MKALPLPSPKVLLFSRSKRYYGQLRLPYRPNEISHPYMEKARGQPLTEDRQSRWIMRNTSDIDETVHLLSVHFKVPKERVLSSYPYRGYGIYLSREHTLCSNAEIGR
jgi:hypothetical protein